MSNSTNKSIADREASKSHHMQDELRHEGRLIDEEEHTAADKRDRGTHVEREVTKESKK